MKKILLIIVSMFVFFSCMTKVDLEQKGKIALTVQWPNVSGTVTNEATNISRAIKQGTTSITVKIHPKGNSSLSQEKTITNTGASKYNVEFSNLIEGTWHILISCYDSSSTLLSEYEEFVDVDSKKDTIVKTDFSGLSNLFIYQNTIYNTYVSDGATNIMNTTLAVNFKGFNDKSINESLFQNPLLDSYVKFIWSTTSDFSIQTGEYSYTVSNINPSTPPSINVGIGDYTTPFLLNEETKYYWKAIATIVYNGNTYTKESPVYSFTTGVNQQIVSGP